MSDQDLIVVFLDVGVVQVGMTPLPIFRIVRLHERTCPGVAAAANSRTHQDAKAGIKKRFIHPGLVQRHAPAAEVNSSQKMSDGLRTVRERCSSRDTHRADGYRIAPRTAFQHQHFEPRQRQAVRRDATAEPAADNDYIYVAERSSSHRCPRRLICWDAKSTGRRTLRTEAEYPPIDVRARWDR